MKILLIGLGSIGKRHLNNILELGYTDISVVTRSGILPNEYKQLQVFENVHHAFENTFFDAAIICTPTALHLDALIPAIQKGVKNIYLEKPISHSLEKMNEVISLANSNNTRIIVGYDLHFDLGLQKVHDLIKNNTVGKVLTVNAQVGQYLPDWRPHEDYSNGMSAKKETGGGVMLDLIHEFDYLYWLIGKVNKLASFNNNTQTLKIETEDVAEVLLQFENNVIGTIHLDYLQPELIRNCLFTCSSGTIFWDLVNCSVSWITVNKEKNFFSYKGFERNQRFLEIMKLFLENGADVRLTSLQSGYESLKMVEAAKYSSLNNVVVLVKDFNITSIT